MGGIETTLDINLSILGHRSQREDLDSVLFILEVSANLSPASLWFDAITGFVVISYKLIYLAKYHQARSI